MNYKKLLFQLIVGCLIFAGSFTQVFADCNIASPSTWKDTTRELHVCVGEFSTKQELRNISVLFDCTGNSNDVLGVRTGDAGCSAPDQTYSLAGFSDSSIAQDTNGKYYTCLLTSPITRAVGRLNIKFYNTNTNATYCELTGIDSKPNDWSASEGLWLVASEQQKFNVLGPTADCVQTAIGCIPFTANGFVEKLFPIFISFGGAIAFLLILFGGVQMMTSAGNPEKLAAGKELIVSAITGLLLIIFSIFILRIIGYDILHIPGFGK